MILVVDSGSTKTDWRLLNNDQISIFKSEGLNPNILGLEYISSIIQSMNFPKDKIQRIYFYGSGCGSDLNKNKLKELLSSIFPIALIEVESDLLGAAIALCGNEKGIIGILGTGSNVAYYDGRKLDQKNISLGYLLGDQGSGSYLGKLFLKQYLNGFIDSEIAIKIKESPEKIIKELYASSTPNRYMASFCPFIFRNRSHPQISKIIRSNFQDWFDQCLYDYPASELNVVGSIAYYFNSELKHVAKQNNWKVNRVIESPIAALALHFKVD